MNNGYFMLNGQYRRPPRTWRLAGRHSNLDRSARWRSRAEPRCSHRVSRALSALPTNAINPSRPCSTNSSKHTKRGRPSTGSWITCARKNRKHRLGHCWCHRPGRRLGQGESARSVERGCPGVQGELARNVERVCPGVNCCFSPGRTSAHSQQGSH